jgi:hypothetical protein
MLKRLYPTIIKHDYGSLSDLLSILKVKIKNDTLRVNDLRKKELKKK